MPAFKPDPKYKKINQFLFADGVNADNYLEKINRAHWAILIEALSSSPALLVCSETHADGEIVCRYNDKDVALGDLTLEEIKKYFESIENDFIKGTTSSPSDAAGVTPENHTPDSPTHENVIPEIIYTEISRAATPEPLIASSIAPVVASTRDGVAPAAAPAAVATAFQPTDKKYKQALDEIGVSYNTTTCAWTFSEEAKKKSKSFLRYYLKLDKSVQFSIVDSTTNEIFLHTLNEGANTSIFFGKMTADEFGEFAEWLWQHPDLGRIRAELCVERANKTPSLFDALDDVAKIKMFAEIFDTKAKDKLTNFFGANTTLEIAKKTDGTNEIEFDTNDKSIFEAKFTFKKTTTAPQALPSTTPAAPIPEQTAVTLTRRDNHNQTVTWSYKSDDEKIFSVQNGFRLIAEQALALRTKEKELYDAKILELMSKNNKTPDEQIELGILQIKNAAFKPAEIKITLSHLGAGSATVRTDLDNARLTETEYAAIKAHTDAGFTVQYKTSNDENRIFPPSVLAPIIPMSQNRISPVVAARPLTPSDNGLTPSAITPQPSPAS